MNFLEALQTHKYVRSAQWTEGKAFCWHPAKTGPYRDLVDCDYFTVYDGSFISFHTTGPDLYAHELLAQDYEVMEVTEEEIETAKLRMDSIRDSHR
mgnify:CR=1 FL=1